MAKRKTTRSKNGLISALKLSPTQTVIWGLAALVLSVSIYHLVYSSKIIPGVQVGGVPVGGLSYNQALAKLKDSEEKSYKTLSLTYRGHAFEVSADNADVEYKWEDSVKRAYEVGRTGNLYTDFKDKVAGLVKPLRLQAYYSYNEDALDSIMAKISGELNSDPENARFVFADNSLRISTSNEGHQVNREDLYNKLVSSFGHMDFSSKEILVQVASPSVVEKDLDQVYSQVDSLVQEPFSVNYEDKTWKISSNDLLDFLLIERDGGVLTLGLNKAKFEAYLEILAQDINQLPRGRVTSVDGDRVVGFELIQDGKELNVKEFTEDFKKALFSGENGVDASVTVVSGPSDPNKYGILSLIGEGTSSYSGSAQARIHNLTLAADRTDGVLVPPGGTYSFNNSVGDISGKTGYDSAYIISNGRTIQGEGGGVCQTSTTLFRAVLDAGLPIITRYPHAYRVYYYELDSPVGFDASIFQPSLDFQFMNDTPNFILVQSSWNVQARTLDFKLYGTPDGREVNISEPVVTNVSPPPEALYQDEPTLKKGVTKQIDFAAWGATVEYTRTVERNGEVILQDTFNSTYRPWRAIYLVGTG